MKQFPYKNLNISFLRKQKLSHAKKHSFTHKDQNNPVSLLNYDMSVLSIFKTLCCPAG